MTQSSQPTPSDRQVPIRADAAHASSKAPKDFFSNLIGSISVDPKQFIEKEDGLYEMATQDSTTEDSKEPEKETIVQKKDTKPKEVPKDMPTFAAEELVTLESPMMDRQFTLLTHIYGTLQMQLNQMVKSEKLVSNVRTLFQTQIGPDQELDIMVNKKANTLQVTLYADSKLQAFLLDKIIALKAYLKKENPHLDDIELDIADLEQRASARNLNVLRQKVEFLTSNS